MREIDLNHIMKDRYIFEIGEYVTPDFDSDLDFERLGEYEGICMKIIDRVTYHFNGFKFYIVNNNDIRWYEPHLKKYILPFDFEIKDEDFEI